MVVGNCERWSGNYDDTVNETEVVTPVKFTRSVGTKVTLKE